MSLEFAFLNQARRSAEEAQIRLILYRRTHPEAAKEHDRIMKEFVSCKDVSRRGILFDKLSQMDGYNGAQMSASWLKENVELIKTQIQTHLFQEHKN